METPEERKARLAALRAQAQKADAIEARDQEVAGTASTAEATPTTEEPVLKFRNYIPLNAKLDHERIAPAEPPKYEEPKVEAPAQKEDETVLEVAPKKINWDLKRDVAKRLEKLERRTMRALLEMAQEEEKRRAEEEGAVAAD